MFSVNRPQLLLGQAVLARRPVVDHYPVAGNGRVTGGAEVGPQNWGSDGHPAVLGKILHAVDQRLLTAVFQEPVGVALKVARIVLEERGLEVEGLAASGMVPREFLVLPLGVDRRVLPGQLRRFLLDRRCRPDPSARLCDSRRCS